VLAVGRLLHNYILSAPYITVALIGMREPQYLELNIEISDNVTSRIDPAKLHNPYVRWGECRHPHRL
jgi:predicted aldo/keto reductase-like oxidoreductase